MEFLYFLVKMAVLVFAMKFISDTLIAYFNSKTYKDKDSIKPKRKIVDELNNKEVNEVHRFKE